MAIRNAKVEDYNTEHLSFTANKVKRLNNTAIQLVVKYDTYWLFEKFFYSEIDCLEFVDKNFLNFKIREDEIDDATTMARINAVNKAVDWLNDIL